MRRKCRKPSNSPTMGHGTRECRLPASEKCANCGQRNCWQHARGPCPQGERTGLGVYQHLSAGQMETLARLAGMTLKRVHVARDNGRYLVVISVECRDKEDNRMTLATHPGGLRRNPDATEWEPEESLLKWLRRRLGEEMPQDISWSKRNGCIPLVTQAARTRGNRQTAQSA